MNDGSTEIDLTWNQSTDDLDPQWVIRYNVYVNGVLTDTVVGSGRSIIYAPDFGSNTISVAQSIRRGTNQRWPRSLS